jgi:hypothetical protein
VSIIISFAMKKSYLLFLLFLVPSFSQTNKFHFFPSGLNFTPLKGNLNEARMGLIYIPENNNMKIDIGHNIDLFTYNISSLEKISAGVEFFAFALSKSYSDFRLQIDAVDGLFSGNVSYSNQLNDSRISARFRVIHNSAHLVDGHWDYRGDKWIDDYRPVPYAKDIAELSLAYDYKILSSSVKNYTSFEYAFLIRPSDLKRFNMNSGIEAALHFIGGDDFTPYTAYNFLLSG